jgi:TetR/AcrR family transcriptional regulator, transcriptional repressor for nem operon
MDRIFQNQYREFMARPRTFDEDEVVAAARDQFWNRGYAATSVDELTDATGLGKGSLYGAFGDKHSLFLRALDTHCRESVGAVLTQLNQPGLPAYDRLAAHVRATAAEIAADTERRGCLMAKSSAELSTSDAAVDRLVSGSLATWRAELVKVLREAQRDGSVRTDVDPPALATMLLGLIRGLETLRTGGVKPGQIKAAAEAALAVVRSPEPSTAPATEPLGLPQIDGL